MKWEVENRSLQKIEKVARGTAVKDPNPQYLVAGELAF
jgi:hypothetical protein